MTISWVHGDNLSSPPKPHFVYSFSCLLIFLAVFLPQFLPTRQWAVHCTTATLYHSHTTEIQPGTAVLGLSGGWQVPFPHSPLCPVKVRLSSKSSIWATVFCGMQLCMCTVVELYRCTFVKAYSCKCLQLYMCIFVKVYSCTCVQLYRRTVAKVYRSKLVNVCSWTVGHLSIYTGVKFYWCKVYMCKVIQV